MKSSIAEDIQISNSIPVSLIKLQTRLLHLIPTRSPLIDWHNILVSSSVATKAGTGGHAPPLLSTGMATGFVQIRELLGEKGVGVVTALSQTS